MKGVGFKLPFINQKFPDCTHRRHCVPDLIGYFSDVFRGPSGQLTSPVLVRSAFCQPEKQGKQSNLCVAAQRFYSELHPGCKSAYTIHPTRALSCTFNVLAVVAGEESVWNKHNCAHIFIVDFGLASGQTEKTGAYFAA